MSYEDSGIGKVTAFKAAEDAIYEAFRWYCCEPNADQKGCAEDCPRRRHAHGGCGWCRCDGPYATDDAGRKLLGGGA